MKILEEEREEIKRHKKKKILKLTQRCPWQHTVESGKCKSLCEITQKNFKIIFSGGVIF